jgi:membrane dipeptidase
MAVAVESEVSERALEIHKRALVVDIAGVNALPYELQRQGGVSVSAVSVSNHDQMSTENSLQSIARYLNYTHRYPNDLMVITSVDDIFRAKQENKVGLMFHFQGIPPIPGIYWIEMFIRIGVRAMALTYNQQNAYGCGAGERVDTGTTYLGRQVIRDMNRLGALVDLSHLGPRTGMEVVEVSTKPVVLTHSNCYSLTPHPRNARDELIKAVAQSGGFVGISPRGAGQRLVRR